jgi:hypothetical protein
MTMTQVVWIPLGMLFVFGICTPYIAMGIRSKWAKVAADSLRVMWWPPAGYTFFEWIKIVEGKLALPEKFGVKRREFNLSELSIKPIKYPIGWPSALQVTAHTAVFDTESYEPLSNRAGMLTLTPYRLANIFNTDVITGTNQKMINEETKPMDKHQKGIPVLVWIIIVVLVAGLIGVGVYMAMNGQITDIKAGLGVQ